MTPNPYWRHPSIFALLAGLLIAGCAVPEHMTVDRGTDPRNQDKDVRFRTTYYFRTFDYCWHKNEENRKIIPRTDTLYRYRMTGKANALFTQVKFESGVLDASAIDPFGTDIVYNGDINGFLVQSPSEVRTRAREIAEDRQAKARAEAGAKAAAAEREAAYGRYMTLKRQLALLPSDPTKDTTTEKAERDLLVAEMKAALAVYNAAPAAPSKPSTEEAKGSTEGTKPATTGPTETAEVKDLKSENAKLEKQLANATADICPANTARRRGFQIMGPEGWKTFDQDQRLLMAMSTSARPLIETLNEYSGRILQSRYNPAEAVLPLVSENLATVQALRAAEGNDPASSDVQSIFAGAITAFGD